MTLTTADLDEIRTSIAMLLPHARRQGVFERDRDDVLCLVDDHRRVFPIVSPTTVLNLLDIARQVAIMKQQLQEYLDKELEVAKKDEHDWSSAGTIARIRKAILDQLELTYE